MAESWLYFSSIGFFVLAAYLCGRLKTTGRMICALFVIFYAFLTIVNNRYYKDDIALYNNILSYEPANPLRKALIVAYLKKGQYEDALAQVEKLKTIQPDSYDAYFYSGMYYLYTGQIEAAEGAFRQALSKAGNCYLYYYLSLCSGKLNRPLEAVNYALESFRLDPEYLPALIRLGDLYLQGSDMIKAKRYFNAALKLDPENKAVKHKISGLKAKCI
jgi:tetratricopeptide (TPR) repeat protein